MSKYVPGAVCIQTMVLEHIELRILPQIIHALGAAAPWAAVLGAAAPGAAVPVAAAPGAYFQAKISQKQSDPTWFKNENKKQWRRKM